MLGVKIAPQGGSTNASIILLFFVLEEKERILVNWKLTRLTIVADDGDWTCRKAAPEACN